MKRTIALLVVFTLTFWACSDSNSILGPENQSTPRISNNISAEPSWIQMPKHKYPSLKKSFSKTQFISKDEDCQIVISENYVSTTNRNVKVSAKIVFLAGTLNEDAEITMIIDDETGVCTFLPHMNFNKEAILSVKIEGMDLDGVAKEDVNFNYFAVDGTFEAVDVNRIDVKIEQGRLELKRAKLPHFSRYGFTR